MSDKDDGGVLDGLQNDLDVCLKKLKALSRAKTKEEREILSADVKKKIRCEYVQELAASVVSSVVSAFTNTEPDAWVFDGHSVMSLETTVSDQTFKVVFKHSEDPSVCVFITIPMLLFEELSARRK